MIAIFKTTTILNLIRYCGAHFISIVWRTRFHIYIVAHVYPHILYVSCRSLHYSPTTKGFKITYDVHPIAYTSSICWSFSLFNLWREACRCMRALHCLPKVTNANAKEDITCGETVCPWIFMYVCMWMKKIYRICST